MKDTLNSSDFLRRLLQDCIGTVIIEASQWNFPDGGFERAYFNDRLKYEKTINPLTQKRLLFVFFHLFHPQNRNGRFGEIQAVEGANALISLLQELFYVDFSFLRNEYGTNNESKRKKLLNILETVLNISQKCVHLDIKRITNILKPIHEQLTRNPTFPTNTYPGFLTILPSAPTEYFIGREYICNEIADLLSSGISCFLHGIGGIGKTEIAKNVVRKIQNCPIEESGITHIAWIDYIENNLGLSLIQGFGVSKSNSNYNWSLQNVFNLIEQYGNRLLLVIDNAENTEDENLLKISSFLSCRILISGRMDGLHNLKKISINELSFDDCTNLFYHYYHNQHDDFSLQKILQLADQHTVTIELLAKIADTEEVLLTDFLQNLIECGFSLSEEEVSSTHGKLQTDARIIEQLQKLFHISDCTESEMQLLAKISMIPSLPFGFAKARTWFGLKNRTDLNQLAKKGWLKKIAQYNNEQCHYQYTIHSVIASATRAQFSSILYPICHDFIIRFAKELEQIQKENTTKKNELIQFSWSINDIFHNNFCQEIDTDFLHAVAEIYHHQCC